MNYHFLMMPFAISASNGLGSMLLLVAVFTLLLLDLHLHLNTKSCHCIHPPLYNVAVPSAGGPKQIHEHLQAEIRSRINRPNDRIFKEYGCAAHVYVEFGAYRAGKRSFAVVGLASKPLHEYGNPSFACSWRAAASSSHGELQNPQQQIDVVITGKATIYYTDYFYGRVYKVVSVMCDFEEDVGTDGDGGELILDASVGDTSQPKERIVALTEEKGEYKWSKLQPPYPYDYLYCGSPLYGDINPRRIREWVAYHALVFGNRSHFVFYDAGGMRRGVRRVLKPWIKLGRVTIQNVRRQSKYDGYYYNQFLIIADCLHRSRFLANWTLFFDVDEYIFFEPPTTAHDVFAQYSENAQVSFTQFRISNNTCAPTQNTSHASSNDLWAIEKLTYHIVTSENVDVKMALNPRKVRSTGVHWAIAFDGPDNRCDASVARYYHYHNTLSTTKRGGGSEEEEEAMCQVDPKHKWNFSDANNDILTYDASIIPFAHKARQLEKLLFSTLPALL